MVPLKASQDLQVHFGVRIWIVVPEYQGWSSISGLNVVRSHIAAIALYPQSQAESAPANLQRVFDLLAVLISEAFTLVDKIFHISAQAPLVDGVTEGPDETTK